MITVGILTISDSSYRGEREDLSGPLIREIVVERAPRVVAARRRCSGHRGRYRAEGWGSKGAA